VWESDHTIAIVQLSAECRAFISQGCGRVGGTRRTLEREISVDCMCNIDGDAAGKRLWPWVTSRAALVLAVLYLVLSLIIALSCSIKPLEALVPQTLATLLYPLDKSNLDPLRLLNFFALAILAVWLVPRDWRGLATPVKRGAIGCGENSLVIYCLGVLLALASHIALVDISDGLAMQIALSLAGALDDCGRNAAKLDQDQTQAAAGIVLWPRSVRMATKHAECRHHRDRRRQRAVCRLVALLRHAVPCEECRFSGERPK
jgi:hypothetical protein